MSVTKTLYVRADVIGTDGTHSYRSVLCPVQWKYYRYPKEYHKKRIRVSYNPDTPFLIFLEVQPYTLFKTNGGPKL